MLLDGFEVDSENVLGARLGRGSYKQVYAVKGHDDLALALSLCSLAAWDEGYKRDYQNMFEEERGVLHQLKGMGIPAVEVLATGVVHSHKYRDKVADASSFGAYLMPRYAASNRSDGAEHLERVIGENTVSSLLKILKGLDNYGIGIWDLQFLLDENGGVVINDPGKIKGNVDYTYGESRDTCWMWINKARHVLYLRSIGDISNISVTLDSRHPSRDFVRSSHARALQRDLLEKYPDLEKGVDY